MVFFISINAAARPDVDLPTRTYAPVMRVVKHLLGETLVPIRIYSFGNATDIVMINVHSNESTSVKAAMNWLRKNGGLLIKIENGTNRNILFKIGKDTFQFDPNHIFSRKGITGDFDLYRKSSPAAIAETEKFAKKILSLVPPEPSCILALHNNFDGGFGIDDYMPTGERVSDAANAFKNDSKDEDDIFFTTDGRLYEQLSGAGYNTILQDLANAADDGSLSMYYHRKGIRYLNCETEHDKQSVYEKMLTLALGHIERFDRHQVLYEYQCHDTLLMTQLDKGIAVYKDSMYLGEIKSRYIGKNKKSIVGRLAVAKTLALPKTLLLAPEQLTDETYRLMVMEKKPTTATKGRHTLPTKGMLELQSWTPETTVPVQQMADTSLGPTTDSLGHFKK